MLGKLSMTPFLRDGNFQIQPLLVEGRFTPFGGPDNSGDPRQLETLTAKVAKKNRKGRKG
jgi:hypothetical protein